MSFPHCVIIPASHIFDRIDIPICEQGMKEEGISIGDDVWIGTGCTILDGVSVGTGCVIGAGSVVKNSIPDNSMVIGTPGKVIKKLREINFG